MESMHITYLPPDEAAAREYLRWMYDPPYGIYNYSSGSLEEEIAYQVDPKNNIFGMYDEAGCLVGYCGFGADARVPGGDYSEEALDIGMMLRPDLTGHGMGSAFASAVIRQGAKLFRPRKLRVTIAGFNQRARRVWEKNGFVLTQSFVRPSDELAFVVMTREWDE